MTDFAARRGLVQGSRRDSRRETAVEPARPYDTMALAELIVMAGEGMPLIAWEKMAEPGETPIQVGRRRAARTSGGFSYRNAAVLRQECNVVGTVLSYALTEATSADDLASAPPMFRPLIELENQVVGSWYVNVLAVRPHLRGLGLGTQLLQHAEAIARVKRSDQLSVITGDINPARRLYERFGFSEVATAPIEKGGWDYSGRSWVLYAKAIE